MTAERHATRARRGRPTKADAAAIDRRILSAAWDAFLAVGYESATMEMIAERAGVTKATLYLRHSDKADLLRATVDERMRSWSAAAFTDWMMGETLEERLVYYAAQVLKWGCHEEVLATARLIHGSQGEAGIIARELDRAIREPMLDLLAREIAERGRLEGNPAKNPRTIARVFIGMLESLAEREPGNFDDTAGQRAIAEQVVAILMRGRTAW